MLNGLEIYTCDIGSAHLEAFAKEKLYIIAGPEFKELSVHILLINKTLYGLRMSRAQWAETLADFPAVKLATDIDCAISVDQRPGNIL